MAIRTPPDAPAGLINSAPAKGTTRPRPDAPAGLINRSSDGGTTADTTSGPGLISGSTQTEE